MGRHQCGSADWKNGCESRRGCTAPMVKSTRLPRVIRSKRATATPSSPLESGSVGGYFVRQANAVRLATAGPSRRCNASDCSAPFLSSPEAHPRSPRRAGMSVGLSG
jgi:hypothetical protein